MATREEAKAIVSQIAKKYGYVTQSDWDKLESFDSVLRKTIEESMRNTQEIAAKTITTLATEVYGSDARFVFELLQNADDNRFRRARDAGDMPSVSFQVYTNRIVVECNEDGFNEKDISAICSVGQSTKSVSYGYIGAKGIGFKSVFIAAWKVLIQSGHFSFCFEHRREEENLGMVIPIWQDDEEELFTPLTRTTLYYHETGDREELDHLRRTIFQQLSSLDHTCLLFLRNIKRLHITLHDDKDRMTNSKEFFVREAEGCRFHLEARSSSANGESQITAHHYHLTRHMASNLSQSVNRKAPGIDKARTGSSQAEIVLAFPLTSSSEPLLQSQELFAFLPIRRSDYNFIIQSDFDLSANRQDIVVTSRRNLDLLDAIAEAFLKAVLQFCEHPTLCYAWPTFLPSLTEHDKFWSDLNDKIKQRLFETPILRSRHIARLRKLDEIFTVAADFKDENDDPLLDDEDFDPFLSRRYNGPSRTILRGYGLENTHSTLVLRLLQLDLASSSSRIKSYECDRWHSALAQKLQKTPISKLKECKLLPMRDGRWLSPQSCSALLPKANGIPVPEGLPLSILDPSAIVNTDRLALYVRLGASEPLVSDVRACVLKCYTFPYYNAVDKETSRSHLHFLYRSHRSKDDKAELRSLLVYSSDDVSIRPSVVDVFLRSDHRYGPRSLLGPTDRSPGLNVNFLHPQYLDEAPEPPNSKHLSWKNWLYDIVGIKRRLRLTASGEDSPSDAWNFVAENRPDQLLGLLRYLWKYEGQHLSQRPDFIAAIQDTNAQNLCTSKFAWHISLRDTYMPLQTLQQECARYLGDTNDFPFLDLDGFLSSEESSASWMFLHSVFLVGRDQNVDFYLRVLDRMEMLEDEAMSADRCQQALDLYATLGHYASRSNDEHDNIKNHFAFNDCVCIPAFEGREASWASIDDCLWDASRIMRTKHPLKHLYQDVLHAEQVGLIAHLFQKILLVKNASWRHLVDELRQARDTGSDDFDHILSLYKCLDQMKTPRRAEKMREIFSKEDLIYVDLHGKNGWYKSNHCLWSSTADIRGKVTLIDHYEELRELFVETLGVQTLTLQMIYDELLQTDWENSVSQLRNTVWTLNALLHTEESLPDPDPLLEAEVFSVRHPDGVTRLSSAATDDFAIGDREYLVTRFRGKIKFLDYTVEECRRLKPFFEWTALTSRFMSNAVEESTTVSGGLQKPIEVSKRDLKRKAYALLRIAATFNSPRYHQNADRLYQVLRNTETIQTDGIRSVSKIFEDDRWVEVDEIVGNQKVAESTHGLTIYVPVDEEPQDFCFCSALAPDLADWLMRDPLTNIRENVETDMVTALSTILAAELCAVNRILDHQGINQISIPYEEVPIVEEVTTEQSSHLGYTHRRAVQAFDSPRRTSSSRLAALDDPPTTPTTRRQRVSSETTISEDRLVRWSEDPRPSPAPLPAPYVTLMPEDASYRRVLDRAIQSAKSATFPIRGALDTSSLLIALQNQDDHGQYSTGSAFHSLSRFERDKQVGAAGELYVFEILSRLEPPLSGFCRDNWQSTIRHYVAIHPDYADMEPWTGRETADITYNDTEGELTHALIDLGYLDHFEWRARRPMYYIEVKATAGNLEAPFYMSKNQYKRMRDIHNASDGSKVYMLLRVHDIEGAGISMKVYLDPEQSRLDKTLVFTAETWSVIPS